jgi:hypothetical protein
MARIRYRYRRRHAESHTGTVLLAVGALAGLAAGVLIAQRYGGLSAISGRVGRLRDGVRERVRDRLGERFERFGRRGAATEPDVPGRGSEAQDYDEEPLDEQYADEGEELEERVLEAFRNDPILSERAVDIGAIGRGIIELTGWVHAEDESHHAVVVTRGVPGVETVVNRLTVREEEDRYEETGRRYERGEAETSARWEGQGVGTGRPRQGTSADPGRHADPRPVLQERWLREEQAVRAAGDDLDEVGAERRARNDKTIEKDRDGGAPLAPSGVPKADHVADPASAEPILREQTGRVTRAD